MYVPGVLDPALKPYYGKVIEFVGEVFDFQLLDNVKRSLIGHVQCSRNNIHEVGSPFLIVLCTEGIHSKRIETVYSHEIDISTIKEVSETTSIMFKLIHNL